VADRDVIVIGAGPAGLSAAVWAHTLRLDYVALDAAASVGGQLNRVYNRVVDYLGVPVADGAELAAAFGQHAGALGVRVETSVDVSHVDVANLAVETGAGARYTARSLVIATGVRPRTLGVPGEADFVGRGVSPSASKYAELFRDKRVLVVGGGDAAFEEALILARVCEHVTLAHRSDRFRARRDFRDRVAADPKIDVVTGVELEAIEGEDRVERVRISGREMEVAGVFVCAGIVPNTELVGGQLETDGRGYVVVDSRQRTSAGGVYAVGDVTAASSLTIAAAVGEGAAAVKDIQRRLGEGA
jgi:thioredoxin reductase (NADPH)